MLPARWFFLQDTEPGTAHHLSGPDTVLVCLVVCVLWCVCVVVVVCPIKTHVCPSKTSPCVPFKNVPVYAGTTRTCVSTCARGARTRGDVLNAHTEVFSVKHITTQHNTPHRTAHTTRHDTHDTTRHDTTQHNTHTTQHNTTQNNLPTLGHHVLQRFTKVNTGSYTCSV